MVSKKISILFLVLVLSAFAVFNWQREKYALTVRMREEMGAALLVEDDVSFFFSTNKPLPRIRNFWHSNAVRKLWHLPSLQQGLMFVQAAPQYWRIMNEITRHPLYKTGMPVLEDALGTQLFICADSSLPLFLESVQRLNTAQQLIGMMETIDSIDLPSDKRLEIFRETFISEKENLRFPGLLIGMKVNDHEQAEKLLGKALEYLPEEMAEYTGSATFNGSEFQVVKVDGAAVPDEFLTALRAEFADDARFAIFEDWFVKQTAVAAVGLMHDHLLIAIGSDLSLLEKFGPGVESSLAASGVFVPLRKRFKAGLGNVAYASSALMETQSWRSVLDEYGWMAGKMIQAMPAEKITGELKNRLHNDAAAFRDEIGEFSAPPAPYLQFTFDNQGVETFTITRSAMAVPGKLDILEYHGENPLFYRAVKNIECADLYDTCVKWLKTAYVYAEEILVPEIPESEVEEFRQAEAVIIPFLQRVDEINRENLIPAIDGARNMLVINAGGQLQDADFLVNKDNAIAIPRAGMVVELNDADSFQEAIKEYRIAVESLVDDMKAKDLIDESLTAFSFPEIRKTDEVYHYDLHLELGDDVFPCARIDDNKLVISTSKRMVEDLSVKRSAPECEVVDLGRPAVEITVIEWGEIWEYLLALNGDVVQELSMRPDMDNAAFAVGLARYHLDTLYNSLAALRSYRSSTSIDEDGMLVKHSWLEVKDIE